ncbi:MAG: DegV family protein [Oscillospiraceae bacterium]|nr:DegV family protein [Oscillospiraceae bacterium]
MSKIVLMTDSASDISAENEKEYGIKIICFQHIFGENVYTSRVDFDHKKYYEMLDAFDGIPSTSQITMFQFQEIYEQEFADGCTDLIYVSINSNASATNSNAHQAKRMFYDEHPEAVGKMNIHIVDSGTYTCGYGYAVVEGAKMIRNGASAEEVVNYISDWCEHSRVYFVMYTLKYAAKSGRINGAAAFLGNALGIKPLMLLKDKSINDVAKIRGEKNILKTILSHTMQDMDTQKPYCIVYGSDFELAKEMADAAEQAVGYPPVDFCPIGAEIAANTGPKLVGLMYYAH